MTITEVGNILFNTLAVGLGVTLWIYLYGLFSMFLRFIWDFCKEYKLRKEMEHLYIESLIKKGLQKEQEELLEQVQKYLEMEFLHQNIREAGFKEEIAKVEEEFAKLTKRKDGEADVDCDK